MKDSPHSHSVFFSHSGVAADGKPGGAAGDVAFLGGYLQVETGVSLPWRMVLRGFAVCGIAMLLSSPAAAQKPEVAPAGPDFVHKVAPLLKEHCGSCHLGDKKKGGFSMNTAELFAAGGENGVVLNPSDLKGSRIMKVLLSDDPDVMMPPPSKDKPRPKEEHLKVVRDWISAGAPWQEGFAFQRPAYNAPVKPRLPKFDGGVAPAGNPLDALLGAYEKKRGLPPAPLVDDAVFVRRLHLDLTGLLPTPEETKAFLEDPASNKRERLVDSLLSRKSEYAEHWLTFWNDLLRNDYGGTGFITGGRRQVSEWLYRSLVENRPYDRMVRELVNPGPDTEGYALGITWRGAVSASQTREVQFAQSVSQSFLGLNLKCASCHDSFIDRWKLTDAYGLAAVYADKPIEIARCEKPTGRMAEPAWPFPEIGQIDPSLPRAKRLERLAELMTHPDNGWFARTIVNRLWAQMLGRGLVHPVDAMGTEPWSEDILDFLGWEFARSGYDLKAALRLIATSRAYQAQAVQRKKEDSEGGFVFKGPRAKRMTAEQFMDAVWQITDTAPKSWDAPVRRGTPREDLIASKPWMASWIQASSAGEAGAPDGATDPKKRVRVIRKLLDLPSKPQKAAGVLASLRDVRLFVNGAEVKAPNLRRHGRVSELSLESVLAAGENFVALVFPEAGEKAEKAGVCFGVELSFKDGAQRSVFSAGDWEWSSSFSEDMVKAGKLALKAPEFKQARWLPVEAVAGPNAEDFSSEKLQRDYVWAVQAQPLARASVVKADLLMRTLGRPNRDQIVTSRPQELSTLEALDLSAGARLSEILKAGAVKILQKKPGSPGEVVDWLYDFALSRRASVEEKAAALEALGSQPSAVSLEDLLWAIVVSPEFQLVR